MSTFIDGTSRESDTASASANVSHMTDSDRYNGYANRETWAFNLHWQNDQGLYGLTLEEAERYMSATYGAEWANLPADEMKAAEFGVGEYIVGFWRDYIDADMEEDGYAGPSRQPLRMFDREVGSWWRIDYKEVGEAVRESLDAER